MGRVCRPVRLLRSEGPRSASIKVLDKVRARLASKVTPAVTRDQIRMLVRYEDASEVDWTTLAGWATEPVTVRDRPLRTAWIMHPPGESSGGHQNIFRFIEYFEGAGHEGLTGSGRASRRRRPRSRTCRCLPRGGGVRTQLSPRGSRDRRGLRAGGRRWGVRSRRSARRCGGCRPDGARAVGLGATTVAARREARRLARRLGWHGLDGCLSG